MIHNEPSAEDQNANEACEKRMVYNSTEPIVLCLYIAGLTPRSTLAVERVRGMCERFLAGRCELTVVDLYLQPDAARQAQIIVVPTLVKLVPLPRQLFIGDMADVQRILSCLNLAS